MEWKKLLSSKRVRQLYEGGPATKLDLDPRSEFERDYGRAVFSTPVRRLQDKAQVFPLERCDAVRTRLTHSMEVSAVSRGLAGAAAEWMLERSEIKAEQVPEITAIAATCGLIHDLGNPPFGHSGEVAISEWFKERSKGAGDFFDGMDGQSQFVQDFLKFDGNAQTQRLLSRLQILADDYGLNLTCATLSASCKYVARSNETDGWHERSKHGFFASENDLIEKIRTETGTGPARNPIAYLVEASDDIVYSTVDLEDGIKKGILRWDEAESLLKKLAGRKYPPLTSALKNAKKKIDTANPTLKGRARDEAMAQAFRTFAIAEAVHAALEAYKARYPQIMKGEYHGELLKGSEASGLIAACKKIGGERVYVSEETLKLELSGRKVIHDLMDLFWSAAEAYNPNRKVNAKSFDTKTFNLASQNYRTVFKKGLKKAEIPQRYCRLQLVTDHISGMTDSYACDLHKALTNG